MVVPLPSLFLRCLGGRRGGDTGGGVEWGELFAEEDLKALTGCTELSIDCARDCSSFFLNDDCNAEIVQSQSQ